MPVYLNRREDPDRFAVRITGIPEKKIFNETLARVKSVPGRRPGRDEKDRFVWEFPPDPETALRIMRMVEPVADAATQALVREYQAHIAESLVTAIGDDAVLLDAALNFCLFPYQRAYVDWAQRHPRCILGDEMGIGKTIQTYGVWREAQARAILGEPDAPPGNPLTREQAKYPMLAVVPNDLRGNWADELRHGPREEDGTIIYPDWPGATVQILDGKNIGKRTKQLGADVEAFIVNWEKLRSDAELLAKQRWGAVIASEAHRAKNPDAQQTKGLWKLEAPLELPETGSSIMNHPGEIWPLLRWCFPDQYARHHPGGGYWPFHYSYVDDYATKHGRVMLGIKNVDQLRFELSDKFVRRTKKQVLPDLPDKLPPKHIPVEFRPEERKLYEAAEQALFLDVAQFAHDQALLELPDKSEADIDARTEEITEELSALPLERLEGRIPHGGARFTKLRQITAQAKARVALGRVLDNPGQPIVIFTWHVPPAEWLQAELGGPENCGLIAGKADASAVAKQFQRSEFEYVVCTIRKSQGFDLYRAHHAIFVEEDTTPDRNHQALDRLHRQGQKSDVSHDILRVPDTVDTGNVAPKLRFKQSIKDELWGRDG